MIDLPQFMFAALQKHDGYSGTAEGPQITDAAEYLRASEVPVPTPGPGQVLIKLRMSSVNPSDLHFIKGEYGQPRVKDTPAGFEGCGDVVAAGKGAEGLIGKRVAFVVAMGGSGAWADYAVTDAVACIPLRPDISDADGAAQIVNPLTAMAMVDIARQAGDAVVISAGTSQLSKLMVALSRDLGLKTIVFVRRTNAVEELKALGADTVIVATDSDAVKQFMAASKQFKPRVFLDSVSDQLSEQIFAAMPNKARWVSYGKLSAELPQLTQMGQLIFMGKQIEGFWLTRWMQDTPPQDQMRVVGEVQARFADGRWKTDVAATLPLRDLVNGLAQATALEGGKVMIVPK